MTDTTNTEPETSYRPLATFDGFVKRWAGNNRDGHLELTLGVLPEHKYEAMPLTDQPGRELRVTVEMVTYEGE